MDREPTHSRCAISSCGWCEQDGVDCRFCSGTGWWRPQQPHRDGNGVIVWLRVDEPCRVCAGTGKEHSPTVF